MERRIKDAELKSTLEEFLALTTMTLSTVGKRGEPHAAAVYFAADEVINLYYFSETSSQHSLDTEGESRAAAAIHAEAADWQQIRGLQMRGEVRAVDSSREHQAAWNVYSEKFPFVIDLEGVIASNQMYVFEPGWIRLLDNRQGFGYKQEWERHAPALWRVSRMTNG